MARKRMFDVEIIDTDLFLEMPTSTRLFYYDLGMRADDDGFINNYKKIMKMTGATEDDLKILLTKQYLIPFDTGVIVIRHWKINNYLRKDRYTETMYKEEKRMLKEDENGAYLIPNNNLGIPMVYTEKKRIEENSIEEKETNKEKENSEEVKPVSKSNIYEERFKEFWKRYPRKEKKAKCKEWYLKNKPSEELHRDILFGITFYSSTDEWKKENGNFIPHPSTFLNQKRWEDFNNE